MSLFGSIGKFFSKIFKSIGDLLKKFIKSLGAILPFLIILAFVLAPYIAPWLAEAGFATLASGFSVIAGVTTAFGPWGALAAGIGAAFLVSPEGTSELISSVGSIIGDVAGSLGEAVGSGIDGLFSSSWVIIGVAAAAIYWLVFKGESKEGAN